MAKLFYFQSVQRYCRSTICEKLFLDRKKQKRNVRACKEAYTIMTLLGYEAEGKHW